MIIEFRPTFVQSDFTDVNGSDAIITASLAEIYTWVGEPDEAFRLLDHLLTVPNGLTVPTLKLDPTWDPLRKDPRFQALIDKYAAIR